MGDLCIRADDLAGAQVRELLREHLAGVRQHSPPESVHALDLTELQARDVTFWSVWDSAQLVGCGALKELDPLHGEVKSMRTADSHLRKGVAASVLRHIVNVARQRGYRTLSLETGVQAAFAPARALYTRAGFERCGPFGNYSADPNSFFMTLSLD